MSLDRLRGRLPVRGGAATRATTTMIDQGVASASNFVVGIVVARISGPTGSGSLCPGLHGLDPVDHAVSGHGHRADGDPGRHASGRQGRDRSTGRCRSRGALAWWPHASSPQSARRASLVGPTHVRSGPSCVGSVGSGARICRITGARSASCRADPKKSLHNDLVFNAVPSDGLRGNLPLPPAFRVRCHLGLGRRSCSGRALWASGNSKYARRSAGGGAFLRVRWPTSRWLASERTANWGAQQLYLIVAGAILGPAALGGLKAAQALVAGPTNVVINGSGSFGLPEASRHFAERGWVGMARVTRIVTGAVVLAAAACGVVVLIFAPTLIKLLYGPEFVAYAPCARIFAISLTIYAFSMGPILNLTTTRQVRPLFMLQLVRLAFSVRPSAFWPPHLGSRALPQQIC